MNPSINSTQHITTLRQTHRTATTLLPVVTATLTVAGAVLAALEARSTHATAESAEHAARAAFGAEPEGMEGSAQSEAQSSARSFAYAPRRMTARHYLATLLGRVLLVALSIAIVFALVYIASASGVTGRAVVLTALTLLVLYLTEKVARRA